MSLDHVDVKQGDLQSLNNTKDNDCLQCVSLRKEMADRETTMQDKINDLQTQLLKKTEALGKGDHFEYL